MERAGAAAGQLDSPLTRVGVDQARRSAAALAGRGVDGIFSSPLARCLRTAAIVGDHLRVPVAVVEALAEVDHGAFAGLTDREIPCSAWTSTTHWRSTIRRRSSTPSIPRRVVALDGVAEYRTGYFAEREVPAILAVLAGQGALGLVVVDGYVHLDPGGRAGLGAHLYRVIAVPVIGVAKTPFRSATHAVQVRRGTATRPLYVTAIGVDPDQAAAIIRGMAGTYRIPDALRWVDALSRTAAPRLDEEL
ncbi:MAG TPA: endonuclease V [Kineosporiaceae bacterium]